MTNAMPIGINLDLSTTVDVAGLARAAEESGFDYVSASDHPCGDRPGYEVWTALCWAAAATTRIGIATRVLATPMRRPAMIAKMAESLDRLSGGRLILGLGSGHSDDEFTAFGVGPLTPRDKVDGLRDTITIAHGLWSGEVFTHTGRVHEVHGAQTAPAAARRIPIWLGTYGPRALRVTGELADGWIPSLGSADPERLRAMLRTLREAQERAQRPVEAVTPVLNVVIDLDDAKRPGIDGGVITGGPTFVADTLRDFADQGFAGFNLMCPGEDLEATARRVGEQLLPLLTAS